MVNRIQFEVLSKKNLMNLLHFFLKNCVFLIDEIL